MRTAKGATDFEGGIGTSSGDVKQSEEVDDALEEAGVRGITDSDTDRATTDACGLSPMSQTRGACAAGASDWWGTEDGGVSEQGSYAGAGWGWSEHALFCEKDTVRSFISAPRTSRVRWSGRRVRRW